MRSLAPFLTFDCQQHSSPTPPSPPVSSPLRASRPTGKWTRSFPGGWRHPPHSKTQRHLSLPLLRPIRNGLGTCSPQTPSLCERQNFPCPLGTPAVSSVSASESLLHGEGGSAGPSQIKILSYIGCCCAEPQRTPLSRESACAWLTETGSPACIIRALPPLAVNSVGLVTGNLAAFAFLLPSHCSVGSSSSGEVFGLAFSIPLLIRCYSVVIPGPTPNP